MTSVCVMPDGRVISGSNDTTLKVWDISRGECIQTLEGHSSVSVYVWDELWYDDMYKSDIDDL